ncbi:hypothetical protein PIB30_015537 [Stylosanthes scabra]|uniref:Uncharacterized protein n=1 Tax=Stylosanthes scabra TaxID=79078 RepID=A0ABU6Z7I3_9FABA|nr:hypothetical protein [Stylosanthes scabra]
MASVSQGGFGLVGIIKYSGLMVIVFGGGGVVDRDDFVVMMVGLVEMDVVVTGDQAEVKPYPAGGARVMGSSGASEGLESNGAATAVENNGAVVGEVSSIGIAGESVMNNSDTAYLAGVACYGI